MAKVELAGQITTRLSAKQEQAAAAALVNETPAPVYLTERCTRCGLSPVFVQGGNKVAVTCGTCGKIVERPM